MRATGLATYPDASVICGRVEHDAEKLENCRLVDTGATPGAVRAQTRMAMRRRVAAPAARERSASVDPWCRFQSPLIFRLGVCVRATLDFRFGGGNGVYGHSTQSVGVYGISDAAGSYGVFASSWKGIAIRGGGLTRGVAGNGTGTGGIGVSGGTTSTTGKGVYGSVSISGAPGVGYAVYGDNNTATAGAFAGYFKGNIQVTMTPIAPAVRNLRTIRTRA